VNQNPTTADDCQPPTATGEPTVSIVTVYYNRAAHVTESIRSLLQQSFTNIEVVVVDDGSTDDTLQVLGRIDDPRLRVIEQQNAGFVVAINRAIRASRGRYVAIHGSGDRSLPERIEAQAAVLDAEPQVGVVGCYVRNQDPFDPSKFEDFKARNGLNFFDALLRQALFTHGEVMFRRQLFDRVGGYREFFRFAQDRDLWLRMSRFADYRIVERPLYQRFKLEDGVGTSAEKLILQGVLSDFAVQCALSRGTDGKDLLDRYGAVAPLLRRPSKALANRYYGFARLMLLAGKLADAQRMLDAARAEAPTARVRILRIFLWIRRKAPWTWSFLLRPTLFATTRLRAIAAGTNRANPASSFQHQ